MKIDHNKVLNASYKFAPKEFVYCKTDYDKELLSNILLKLDTLQPNEGQWALPHRHVYQSGFKNAKKIIMTLLGG